MLLRVLGPIEVMGVDGPVQISVKPRWLLGALAIRPGAHNARFIELLGHGVATSEGDRWLARRRLLQPAFHRDQVAAMASVMAESAEELGHRWERLPADALVDMSREMMVLTLTVAARTLLGVDAFEEARRIGPSIDQALRHVVRRIESLAAWPLWIPLPGNRRYIRVRRELDAFIRDLIARRRADSTGPSTLLDLLFTARDANTGRPLTEEEARDEVMTMLMAGHESTSVALSWAWYLLDQHPTWFEAIRDEATAVAQGRPLTLSDLEALRLTSMVVDETLRLYPPAWSTTRMPNQDDTVGGKRIPKGKFAIVSPYVTHRHPAYWVDPDSFRPERFEHGIPSGPDRFAYIPFGGGPHMCMGVQFALMEAKLVLATLARTFRPTLAPGYRVGLDPQIALRPLGGLPMRLNRTDGV